MAAGPGAGFCHAHLTDASLHSCVRPTPALCPADDSTFNRSRGGGFFALARAVLGTFLGFCLTNGRVAPARWPSGWHLRGLFSIVAARKKA